MKRKDNIVDEFDQFIESYTQDMMRWVPHYLTMLNSIGTSLSKNFIAQKILDLGCGNGNATQVLLNRYPNAHYVVLDASIEMLNNCIKRFPDANIKICESFFMEAEFEVEYFDVVIASFSLHHLKNEEKQILIKRIKNWLKPGGVFVYTDLMIDREDKTRQIPFLKEWELQAKALGTSNEEWDWLMEHHQMYDFTQDYLIQQNYLSNAGFSNNKVTWQIDYWTTLMATK